MHGNDFKHHFRRLYIIFNHMESYKKLPKSYSKVTFSVKSKVPEQFLFNFFEACSIQAFQQGIDSILHTAYDSYDRSNVDVWIISYEVCNILYIH